MIDNLSRKGYSVTRLSASLSGSAKWPLLKSWHSLHLGIFSRGGATAAKIYAIRANLSQELGSLLPYSPVSTSGEQLKNGQVSGSLSLYPDMAERERVMEGHRQRAIRSKRWWTGPLVFSEVFFLAASLCMAMSLGYQYGSRLGQIFGSDARIL
jgi:hypothetical protein